MHERDIVREFGEVREQRGLAYSSYSYFSPMAQSGPYQAGLQTRKDQTDEALQVVRDSIATWLRDGPTQAELKAAKDNLIGGFALRIDNNRKILDNISVIGYYQLPLDYLDTWTDKVAKVTVADPAGPVVIHLGDTNFLERYKIYTAHGLISVKRAEVVRWLSNKKA